MTKARRKEMKKDKSETINIPKRDYKMFPGGKKAAQRFNEEYQHKKVKSIIMDAATLGLLFVELNNWIPKYEFSFQFWGEGNNNVFIQKDDVEIASFGGEDSIEDILIVALNFIYKINQVPSEKRIFNKIKNGI